MMALVAGRFLDGDEDKFTVISLPASPRNHAKNHATAANASVLVALLRIPIISLYQVDDDDVFHDYFLI